MSVSYVSRMEEIIGIEGTKSTLDEFYSVIKRVLFGPVYFSSSDKRFKLPEDRSLLKREISQLKQSELVEIPGQGRYLLSKDDKNIEVRMFQGAW